VASAPPKPPICALKLGDRSSPSGVTRGLFPGFKRTRGVTAAALLIKLKGGARTVFQESKCANFLKVKKGAHRHGSHVFVAAAPPKPPICALKLGDRSSPSGVSRGSVPGFEPSRGVSAAALADKA